MVIMAKKICPRINEKFLEDIDWLIESKIYNNRDHMIDDSLGKLITLWKTRYFIYMQMPDKDRTMDFKDYCISKKWYDIVEEGKGAIESNSSIEKRAKDFGSILSEAMFDESKKATTGKNKKPDEKNQS